MNTAKTWFLGLVILLAAGAVAGAKSVEYNLAQSGAVLSGYWGQSTADERIFIGGANGSQLDAQVTGKTVEMTVYSLGANSVTVTVDGKSYMPTFFKISEWTTLTISLGSAGSHHLTVKQTYLGSPFYLDTGAGVVHGPTFLVQGAAPSMGPPATGFGPIYQLSDPVNVGQFIQPEGGVAPLDAGGYPSVLWGTNDYPDQGVYFTANATGTIQGWMYGSGNLLSLYQDGVKIGELTTPESATYQWVTLFQGDGAPHRYGVVSAYAHAPGYFFWSLMTVGGTLAKVPTVPRPSLLIFGDSIALGLVGTLDDASEAFGERLGSALGWQIFNRGISYTTVHEFPSGAATFTTESGEARTSEITSVSKGARGMVIIYGTNDMAQEGGPEPIPTFQTSYQSMLANIVAGVPSTCPIVCVGIMPRTFYSPDTIATWNAAIQAAIAAVAAPNVTYADPSGWGLLQDNGPTKDYTDPAGNTSDGLHPNAQGYGIVLANLEPYFAPPSAPTVTSAESAVTPIGQPIEYQTTASYAPFSYGALGLPTGLHLNAATGAISGTPTVSGTFTVDLSATNASGTGTQALQLTVVRPAVKLIATVPEISVNGGEYGAFTLSIPTARARPLTVSYSVGGTAVGGTNYAALSGKAVIPVGTTSKVINIKPLGNLNGAAFKTIKLKLEAGPDYSIGTVEPVKVKILSGS